MVLMNISYTEIPNFVIISILGVLAMTLVFGLFMKKFFITPIITFVILGITSFMLPNFFDITYPPLLGYATFLTIGALILNLILMYVLRNKKHNKVNKTNDHQLSESREREVTK